MIDFGADPTGFADSTTAIQNALNASAGLTIFPDGNYKTNSIVTLPAGERIAMGAGTWTHAGIRFTDSTTTTVEGSAIDGLGIGKTTLKLADGMNVDAITNTNFDRLKRKEIAIGGAVRASNVVTVTTATSHNFVTGDVIFMENVNATSLAFNGRFTVASTPSNTTFTFAQTGANESSTLAGFVGSAYGVMRVRLEHMTIDCNRTNNLSSGDCVKLYSRGQIIQNVEIKEARGKGLWTESSTVVDFTTNGNELEGSFRSIKIHGTSDIGLLMKGPHDSNYADVIIYSAGGDCAQFWRPFRFNNMNFFICNGYGMRLTSLAAVMGTNIQSEPVIIDSTIGGAAPSPNVMHGVLFYGNGTGHPALEVQGYGNDISGYIKNDADTAPMLKLNGGAGVFTFIAGTALGSWVDYGSVGRSNAVINIQGSVSPGVGYELGTKLVNDQIRLWDQQIGTLVKSKEANKYVPGALRVRDPDAATLTGSCNLIEGNTSASGYMECRAGTSNNRLGYIGNSSTDLAVTLENSANFTVSGGGMSVSTGTASTTLASTAATTRAGLRNANTRNITRNSSVAAVDCAGGALNATVTQLLDGAIFTCATAQTLTLPTWQGASGTVQALPGTPAVGDVIQFTVSSTAAANFTLAGGTGGTVVGNAVTNNAGRVWTCRLTSVTGGSETASCY